MFTRTILILLMICSTAFAAVAQLAADSLPVPVRVLKKEFTAADSLRKKADSIKAVNDSLIKNKLKDTLWRKLVEDAGGQSFLQRNFKQNPFFGFTSARIFVRSDKKEFFGKENLFYSIIAIFIIFACLKLLFPKYMADLFRVAFRTTMKQRQIGEQLAQTPLPSLLLNGFFIVSGAFYADFLLQHYHFTMVSNFWLLYLYCVAGLAMIYMLKFFSLKFSGWLFNIPDTTNGYIFIVFIINKIMGIFLLPFLVILAFAGQNIYQAGFALSIAVVAGLFMYRFVLAYGLVRNQVRVNPFHFILFITAFEIIPVLLIYKLLMRWF